MIQNVALDEHPMQMQSMGMLDIQGGGKQWGGLLIDKMAGIRNNSIDK